MKLKICPKCESTKIAYKPTVFEAANAIPPTFKCENCGYKSIAFPEKEQ